MRTVTLQLFLGRANGGVAENEPEEALGVPAAGW